MIKFTTTKNVHLCIRVYSSTMNYIKVLGCYENSAILTKAESVLRAFLYVITFCLLCE